MSFKNKTVFSFLTALLLVVATAQPVMAFDLGKIISRSIEKSLEDVIDKTISSVITDIKPSAKQDDGLEKDLSEGVIIFGYNGCPYCRKAYAFLEENNIPYELMDTQEDSKANRLAQQNGIKGVPVIFVNGEKLAGYSDSSYTNLFTKHGVLNK